MNLLKRVVVALIFMPVLLLIFYVGKLPLLLVLMLLSVICMWEFRKMMVPKGIILSRMLIAINAIVTLVACMRNESELEMAIVMVLLFLFMRELFANRLQGSIIRISVGFFGIAYTALFPATIYRISQFPRGSILLLMLLAAIWITDSGAYFVGMKLGRHRGIIKASPNKSLEGFIGGFIFCGLGFVLYHHFEPQYFSWKEVAAVLISAGVFGQIGDLIESMLKRDVGIKDSSDLIPGHGGMLDRFDSILLAAPVYYFLLTLIR